MRGTGFSDEERVEVWRRYRTGESMRSISRGIDRSLQAIRRLISARGGRTPRPHRRSGWRLSLVEREEISRGVAVGDSGRRIARRLGRAPSTVCREIARNGGRWHYRARRAEAAARRRKTPKLARCAGLRRLVEDVSTPRARPPKRAWPGHRPSADVPLDRCGATTAASLPRARHAYARPEAIRGGTRTLVLSRRAAPP